MIWCHTEGFKEVSQVLGSLEAVLPQAGVTADCAHAHKLPQGSLQLLLQAGRHTAPRPPPLAHAHPSNLLQRRRHAWSDTTVMTDDLYRVSH